MVENLVLLVRLIIGRERISALAQRLDDIFSGRLWNLVAMGRQEIRQYPQRSIRAAARKIDLPHGGIRMLKSMAGPTPKATACPHFSGKGLSKIDRAHGGSNMAINNLTTASWSRHSKLGFIDLRKCQ